MHRTLSLIPIALAAALAGCGQHSTVSRDVRNTGHDIGHSLAGIGRDPDVRQAEADLRQAGRDAGHDLRRAANEARDALRRLGHDSDHRAADRDTHDRDSDHTNG